MGNGHVLTVRQIYYLAYKREGCGYTDDLLVKVITETAVFAAKKMCLNGCG